MDQPSRNPLPSICTERVVSLVYPLHDIRLSGNT